MRLCRACRFWLLKIERICERQIFARTCQRDRRSLIDYTATDVLPRKNFEVKFEQKSKDWLYFTSSILWLQNLPLFPRLLCHQKTMIESIIGKKYSSIPRISFTGNESVVDSGPGRGSTSSALGRWSSSSTRANVKCSIAAASL
jgi:hypothetical protein